MEILVDLSSPRERNQGQRGHSRFQDYTHKSVSPDTDYLRRTKRLQPAHGVRNAGHFRLARRYRAGAFFGARFAFARREKQVHLHAVLARVKVEVAPTQAV